MGPQNTPNSFKKQNYNEKTNLCGENNYKLRSIFL